MKTDDEGRASFEFTAPDSLTTYRVVAVGETRESQFGGDASTTLKISKPLLVDASLPRFLRDRDEVELRAVVRQNFADSDEVHMQCLTDANCELAEAAESTQTAWRNVPVVFRFRAKVADRRLLPVKIRFDAKLPVESEHRRLRGANTSCGAADDYAHRECCRIIHRPNF